MSNTPPDDPFGGYPFGSAKTEIAEPAGSDALVPAGDAFAKGHTVFGPLPANFGRAPLPSGETLFGEPPPEALATPVGTAAPSPFGPRGGQAVGHTEFGEPPPEALAVPPPPRASTSEREVELERARALFAEGVRAGQAGYFGHADACLRQSLDLRRRYCPPGDALVVHGCVSLGTLYLHGQRPDLAEPLYREAWALCQQRLGDLHPDTAARAVELARVLRLLQRRPEAYGFLRAAHDGFAATLGAMHPATLGVLEMLRQL